MSQFCQQCGLQKSAQAMPPHTSFCRKCGDLVFVSIPPPPPPPPPPVYRQPVASYQPQEPDEDREKKSFLVPIIIGGIVAVLAIGGLLFFLLRKDEATDMNQSQGVPKTELVPNAVNKGQAVVQGFLDDLGARRFSYAYYRCYLPELSGFKSVETFSSTNAFGGITEIKIKEIKTISQDDYSAKVYTSYFAADPANRDGNYEQMYYVTNMNGQWKITKIEKISAEQW